MTWNFTQERPAVLRCGAKCRRQQLSLMMGVVSFSDGNTHASGRESTEKFRHSSIAARSPSGNAARRTKYVDFGGSMSPR